MELNKAMQLAKNGKWGPVHVNIPRDILSGNESFESFVHLKMKLKKKILIKTT